MDLKNCIFPRLHPLYMCSDCHCVSVPAIPRPCSVPLSAPLSTREAADWDQLTSLSSLSVISSSLSLCRSISLARQKISLDCDPGTGLTRSPAPDAALAGRWRHWPRQQLDCRTRNLHPHRDLTII